MLFHIVSLLAITLVVPILCAHWWARPSLGRVAFAIVLGVLAALPALVFGVHMCDRGVPLQQWAIPCTAMVLALACIGHKRVRRVTACALALLAFVLSLDYAGRVHDRHVVGNPHARCTIAHAQWHTLLTGLYAAKESDCHAAVPR